MTIAHPETATHAPIHGPGAQLAQARADLHLAQEDVAAKRREMVDCEHRNYSPEKNT